MKKLYSCLIICFSFLNLNAQVQISIPESPKKIEFANIIIELDDAAQKNVNAEIIKLLTPQNKFLELKLERMQWYFPIIEKILEEEEVPDDFKYLAVLESSLLPEAISSSNAVGFWQFKEVTAKEMGLIVDNNQDDRKNIIFSTHAASLYLKKNNLIYRNWISCMFSYKEGVKGAESSIPVEWSFASEIKFDENTPVYLIKALAHRIAYEHRLNRLKDSQKTFIQYVTKGKSLAEIAVELTVDINELRKYNPWIYGANIPSNKDYSILILSNTTDSNEINEKIKKRTDLIGIDVGFPQLKRITMVSTSPDSPIFYEINEKNGILAQPGDEVAQMSSKSKIKIGKFLSYNNMNDKDMTKEGSIYYLQKKNKKAKVPFHTVLGEQTLWDVSQMYGVQLKYLLKYNRMKDSQKLQPGRIIWMQKTRPKNQPIEVIQEAIPEKDKLPMKETFEKKEEVVKIEKPIKPKENIKKTEKEVIPTKPIVKEKDGLNIEDPLFETKPVKEIPKKEEKVVSETPKKNTESRSSINTHTVKQGETLFSISKKYNLTISQIRSINGLKENEFIRFNQVLKVNLANALAASEKELTNSKKEKEPEKIEILNDTKPLITKPSVLKNSSTTKKTHEVSAGETIFSISKKYNESIKNIQNWNTLDDNKIKIGQTLIISAIDELKPSTTVENKKPISNAAQASSIIHKVSASETLFSISKKYDVSVADLKKWNDLTENKIKVGEKLIIKN